MLRKTLKACYLYTKSILIQTFTMVVVVVVTGMHKWKYDRPTILINGKQTGTADFPCSHINLCYKHETNNWYQTEPNSELVEQGRDDEDAYLVHPKLHRDIPKMMVQMMLNIKGRNAVSREVQ